MRISKTQLKIIFICVLMCLINLIVMLYMDTFDPTKDLIIILSRISVVEIFITIIAWERIDKIFISPFIIFYLVTIVYGVGQVFGWALGFDVGEKDLLFYGIQYEYIFLGLCYSINGILLMFAGAVLFYNYVNSKIKNEQTEENLRDYAAINLASKILFVISLPFLIFYMSRILPSIMAGGYIEYYVETANFTKLELISAMIADLFPVSLLLMYASNIKKNNHIAFFALLVLVTYIIVLLYIGGRSVAVELLLALIITNSYLGNGLSKKKIIVLFIATYVFLGVLNVIAETRSTGDRTLYSTLSGFSLGFVDTVGKFFGEMGWQMSSISWTMEFIDDYGAYKFGLSYLTAFTVIIPNFGQWIEHPDTLVNAGMWMQNILGRTTGMGYSFIAETYYNFWWFGLIAMFLIGCAINRWLTCISHLNAKYNYRYMAVIIMAFATILRPFVRSTFSASMRKVFYIILIVLFLIYILKYVTRKARILEISKYEKRSK